MLISVVRLVNIFVSYDVSVYQTGFIVLDSEKQMHIHIYMYFDNHYRKTRNFNYQQTSKGVSCVTVGLDLVKTFTGQSVKRVDEIGSVEIRDTVKHMSFLQLTTETLSREWLGASMCNV